MVFNGYLWALAQPSENIRPDVFISGAFGQLSVSTHPASLDILPRCVYPPLPTTTYRIPTCPAVPQNPCATPSCCYRAAPQSGAFPSLDNTPWGRSLHSHKQTLAGSRPLRDFGAVVAACLAEWDTVWCWDMCRSGHLDSCSGSSRHCRRLFAVNRVFIIRSPCCFYAFHGVWKKWRRAKWPSKISLFDCHAVCTSPLSPLN